MKDLPKIINTKSLVGKMFVNGKYYYDKNRDIFVIVKDFGRTNYKNINDCIIISVIRFELNWNLDVKMMWSKYYSFWREMENKRWL
jgi:hypothetical protein